MREFQDRTVFIGNLPEQYREGQALLAERIRELEERLQTAKGEEYGSLIERLTVLRGMLRHTIDVREVLEDYYVPGSRLNPQYTCLARKPKTTLRARRLWGYHIEGSDIDIDRGGKTREANPPPAPKTEADNARAA